MQDTQHKNTGSDEIDLSQLFRWIGNGFRNFGNGILKGLAGLRATFFENKKKFIVIIIGGLVLGFLYSEGLKKKYYKSSMILSCDYLNSRIVTNSFDKLNLLCNEPEREGLAEELGIDQAIAKNILEFSAKPFVAEKEMIELEVLKEQLNNVAENKKDLVGKIIEKIDIENKHAFQIEVTVLDPNVVKDLEKKLVSYFAENSYVKNRVEVHRANLLDRKSKLIRESKKLDSLKAVLYENLQNMAKQNREGSNNVILSDKQLTNPIEVYTQDLNLYYQLQDVEKDLFVKPDFEVIDGFTSFKEPDSASLLKILVLAFFSSLVGGYLIIGLWRFDRYLANLSKNS